MNRIVVERDLTKNKAPGRAAFLYDGEVIAECDVITGGKELDPSQYGGPTPPGVYAIINRVEYREAKYKQVCSILFPCFDLDREYPRRTFWRVDVDPFRWHYASKNGGRSTGCICPQDKDEFEQFNELINQAIDAGEIVYVEVL